MTSSNKSGTVPAFGPLAGVRVVSCGSAIAGPFAAQLMGEWGADVIWIENPKVPEMLRADSAGAKGLSAEMERRNQRTIALDLREKRGQEVFLALLTDADILVENSKGGQFERMGLSDTVLWDANPSLVIAHVSGFGQSGEPEAVGRPAYDAIAQAFGCYMQLNGPTEGPPIPASPIPGDYLTALFAASSSLAALLRARSTGEGESIDIAMFEVLLRAGGASPTEYLNLGIKPLRRGGGHARAVGIGLYACKDGVDIYVVMHGAGILQRGLAIMGLDDPVLFPPDLHYVAKESPEGARVQAAMVDYCKSRNALEVEQAFSAAGIPCSRVYTYDIAEDDPHYKARGVFKNWESVSGATLRGVKVVPDFKRRPGQVWRGAPTIGMDNEAILKEAGFDDESIRKLYEAKLIAKR